MRYPSHTPSINYADYLNFEKSKDVNNNNPKNIENMLNIICNTDKDKDTDYLKDNSNITKIMNKLNGHNIHTASTINDTNPTTKEIEDLKKASDDAKDKEDKKKLMEAAKAAKTEYDNAVTINKFINKIKDISATIKANNEDNNDNKDLDFVKLVLVYLNNKKIYNDNTGTPGQLPEVARTYAQSLLNIITNVIPYSNNLFGTFKTNNYDIENVLIGAVPLLDRHNISITEDKCSIEYATRDDFANESEKKGCYYNNYLIKLKETRGKLKQGFINRLIAFTLSMIAIMVLFYYIYINYNIDNTRWSNITAIKMVRLSQQNPLNWLSIMVGNIMLLLNNENK